MNLNFFLKKKEKRFLYTQLIRLISKNKRNKFIPPSDKSNNDEGDGEDGGCNENRSGRRRTVDRNLTLSIAYLFDTMSE